MKTTFGVLFEWLLKAGFTVFTKDFFIKKVDKEKNLQTTKSMKNYPVGKELTRYEKRTTHTNAHAFNTSST